MSPSPPFFSLFFHISKRHIRAKMQHYHFSCFAAITMPPPAMPHGSADMARQALLLFKRHYFVTTSGAMSALPFRPDAVAVTCRREYL